MELQKFRNLKKIEETEIDLLGGEGDSAGGRISVLVPG